MSHPRKNLPTTHRQTMEEATAEAESRPLEFDPAIRAQYIRSMIRDIPKWLAEGDTEDTLKQRIPDFVESYPELFKKLVQQRDMTPLHNMLTMLDRMGEGRMSQHQASIAVGKKLVDRYITPQLQGKGKEKK